MTAIVPVTVQGNGPRDADTDVPFHPSYKGNVVFQNKFKGELPATDYPKLDVCVHLFCSYRIDLVLVLPRNVHSLPHYCSGLGSALL